MWIATIFKEFHDRGIKKVRILCETIESVRLAFLSLPFYIPTESISFYRKFHEQFIIYAHAYTVYTFPCNNCATKNHCRPFPSLISYNILWPSHTHWQIHFSFICSISYYNRTQIVSVLNEKENQCNRYMCGIKVYIIIICASVKFIRTIQWLFRI